MSARTRAAFILCVGAIVVAGVALAWWAMHPPYGVLFRDLREADAAEITTALDQQQVPYRLADDGSTVLVPEERVYESRMKLVSQGVPKGNSVGFELFKDSDYGVTEFAQKVNFQRALQGELERTIESLDEVTSARVHLTLRRDSLFDGDKTPAKASVTLTLKPGRHVDTNQVAGIQRLAASAVDGLEPSSVVVLDERGTPLTSASSGGNARASLGEALDEQEKAEQDLRARAAQLLAQALPGQAFSVSVDVALNFDRVKRVSEHLIAQGKDGNGLLSHVKTNSTGKLTGDPDPDGKLPATASLGQESDYAHGREQEEYESAPGRIQRITVGVVVPSGLAQGEVARLEDVVAAGLGLDLARGDRVKIAGFAAAKVPSLPTPPPVAATSGRVPTLHPAATAAGSSSLFALGTAIVAVLIVLVAAGFALAFRRKEPVPRLNRDERDELLRKMIAWVDEGAIP
jgi:flagellar M-ring protein FliF